MNDRPETIVIPDRFTITVTVPVAEGVHRSFTIEGRTAKLIAWCAMHRARIERIGTGWLGFNLGLKTFQPEIRESFPHQPATPEGDPNEDGRE